MLNEKVQKAIQDVRPSLQADGGDIELVSVDEDGTVKVRLTGACGTCPMSTMTLKQGVESYLKKVIPEVKQVVQPRLLRRPRPRTSRSRPS
jgi:Fe-S cluster biogenesis protein NfuA